ncbi:conjugative transposon protein TraM [candidate division KSB1 bacterium]|nr:conjugative transposon protein TraM [candidate division KSB1 bacterium]
MCNLFSEILEKLHLNKARLLRKLIIWGGLFVLLIIYLMSAVSEPSKPTTAYGKVSLGPREAQNLQPKLNYDFIKIDTVKIPSFKPAVEPLPVASEVIEPLTLSRTEKTPSQTVTEKKQVERQPARARAVPDDPFFESEPSRQVTPSNGRNPNMIVLSNLAESSFGTGGGTSTFSGHESALVKVMLPNHTPIANGSLVEARVLHDTKVGTTVIPRRTRLIGIASLYNRRVEIDLREIVLDNVTRTCAGRAFDLKKLRGIPYSPVTSEVKRALLEELRDAVSGVPVVGRVANRTTMYNDMNQDVSELDEGLEFYFLIESIY